MQAYYIENSTASIDGNPTGLKSVSAQEARHQTTAVERAFRTCSLRDARENRRTYRTPSPAMVSGEKKSMLLGFWCTMPAPTLLNEPCADQTPVCKS
ncbi:hypothetical protein LMG27174_06253 [Paraburkholderia rhynchosiae]|uniref:Uncharacterized protein n=1 Tax=Paraburkholderia rhynchosiae TaxID=487049 RepID=A0A6J5CGR8_9BURK|nr:hypothetical protein LMG27174_06253 [Paraburkholderia rhynchosiae]